MKKNKIFSTIIDVIIVILFFTFIIVMLFEFLKAMRDFFLSIVGLFVLFTEQPLWLSLISIVSWLLISYIMFSWDKRDDFFYFVASILSSPSEYIYQKRKNLLLSYYKEIKKLVDCINFFTNIDSKKFTKEDFWKLADAVSEQNERLEKNRKALEKQNNRINIAVQLFILFCGIITSLFL